MELNWNDMRYFLALCRTGSMVAAANDLRVTHGTISRRLTALEETLQTRLFERTGKGCYPTPEAERLIPFAEQMESSAIYLEEHVAGGNQLLKGTIRIGAPDGFGNCFLAPRLGHFQDNNPGLEVELLAVPMYFSLTKREIDISITVEQPTSGNVVARRLTGYRLGLFASRSYLAARPEIHQKEDLRHHRIIGYIDDLLFDRDLGFMKEIFPHLKVQLRSTTVVAQRNAIAAGAGVGVLPYFLVDTPELVAVLPEIFIERAYWLQVHPNSRELARLRATMDFIIGQVEASRELFLSRPG